MINLYIYIMCILLMFTICIKGLRESLRAPYKIKIISILVYSIMILKFISISLMLVFNNIKNLYFLKPLYFLDFLAIPIAMLVCFYICIKNNKFNLRYIIYMLILICSIFLFLIFKYDFRISMYRQLYYIMELLTPINIYIYFIFINLIFLILCFTKNHKKYINRNILYLMFLSILVNITDIIISLFNVNILPMNVLGNLIWIYTLYISVGKIVK